jgi:hypothetical protein
MRLDVKAFAITAALVWGLGVFLLTWWIIAFDGSGGEETKGTVLFRNLTVGPGSGC